MLVFSQPPHIFSGGVQLSALYSYKYRWFIEFKPISLIQEDAYQSFHIVLFLLRANNFF